MSNVDIQFFPGQGLTPHPSVCSSCHRPSGAKVYCGKINRIYECVACGNVLYGGVHFRCPVCDSPLGNRKIGPEEPIPMGHCRDCNERIRRQRKAVAKGGVYTRCVACGFHGVLKGSHPVAIATRKALNIQAPEPCLLTLDEEHCPECKK
jgi:hypothetical protein